MAKVQVGFLSDDMVILGSDGRVRSYPKPLTISFHTLGAINAQASLSRFERLLLHVQSRVHSRSGRLMALLLTRIPLPAATINAVVQFVVPPPKFSITRLIPQAVINREAVVVHRVEIERGPDRVTTLSPDLAESTLLRNCEDAYGFPPYKELEPFLMMNDGKDLKLVERAIIRDGLGRCEVTLVSSQDRNWWGQIGSIVHDYANGVAQPDEKERLAVVRSVPATVAEFPLELIGDAGRVQDLAPLTEVAT
jgi:hypothetical protein